LASSLVLSHVIGTQRLMGETMDIAAHPAAAAGQMERAARLAGGKGGHKIIPAGGRR
jgi:hypothetical protein